MKKIEIIKDSGPSAVKMTIIELDLAINDPKELVAARGEEDVLFYVVFEGNDYVLIDNNGDVDAKYTDLDHLVDDYELFIA